MSILEGQTLKSGWDDNWLWKDSQNCKYSVKSAYEILSSSTTCAFNYMFIVLWGYFIPPSAQGFAWRALQDRIVIKQNLVTRSIHVVDSLCVLCGSEEETTSHLLISCPIVIDVWNLCHNCIGVSSVNHFDMNEHFEQFHCT